MGQVLAFDGYTDLASLGPNKADLRALAEMGGMYGYNHLTALYRTDFLARKVVDAPADDATDEWRQWIGDAKKIEKLANEEKRLRVKDRVRHALTLARLHGGSAIIIHDGTGADHLSEPFDPASVKRGGLKALIVAERNELTPENFSEFVQDPAHLHYMMPERWTYQPRKAGAATRHTIHHSRLVFFRPDDPSPDTVLEWWWGESVLLRMHRLIEQAGTTRSASAHMLQDANNDVLKVGNLRNLLATEDGTNRAQQFATAFRNIKSIYSVGLIDAEDEYTRNAMSFAGVKDVMLALHEFVAGAADIPLTRLLGRSPGGMNATGEHDMRNYLQSLSGIQTRYLEPAMPDLDAAIMRSALGNAPKTLWYEWRLPDLSTEKERIENAQGRAKLVAEWKKTGTVPSPVLEAGARSVLTEHGDLPAAESAYEAWDAAGNEIDFEDDGGVTPQEPDEGTEAPGPDEKEGDEDDV
jgi:phage-related protein (TIGR01555 family)